MRRRRDVAGAPLARHRAHGGEAGEVERALTIFAVKRVRWARQRRSPLRSPRSASQRPTPGCRNSDEARARSDAYADALEAEAALAGEALADETRSRELGVPRWALHRAFLVDAYLRAADAVRRVRGELGRAANLLDRALDAVPAPPTVDDESPTETKADPDALLRDAVIAARMRVDELLGDTAHAATLAEARLQHESDGPTAAALAMRIAEQAASENDAAKALEAVSRAVKHDPACAPARALQLDILADSADSSGYAEQLEALTEVLPDRRCPGARVPSVRGSFGPFAWATCRRRRRPFRKPPCTASPSRPSRVSDACWRSSLQTPRGRTRRVVA